MWLFRGPLLSRKTVFGPFSCFCRGFFVALILGKFYAYSPWKSLLKNLSLVMVERVLSDENSARLENLLVSHRIENPPNPKIGQKYHPDSRIPPTTGERKNTPKIAEKYPQNTNFVFFESPGGYLKGYFGSLFFCILGGIFEFLGFPIL